MTTSSETDFFLEERSKIENSIIQKAWDDPSFKETLLKDPSGTLAKEMGLASLPDAITVKVVEDSDRSITIVIPHNSCPTANELGLDEEDIDEEIDESKLAKVAGGTTYVAKGISDFAQVYKWNFGALGMFGLNKINGLDRAGQINTMKRIGKSRR